MLAGFTQLALTTAPIIALLVWLQQHDRRLSEAGRLRADIHHAANRALGGESLLAIRVDHPTPWRRGHVHLSAPLGYEWLVGRYDRSLRWVMRVLVHWNTELLQYEITHVYLRDTVKLRPDLAAAQ